MHIISRRLKYAAMAVAVTASLGGCGQTVEQAAAKVQADIARQKAAGTYPVHFRWECEAPNICTPAQRASWEAAMREDDAFEKLKTDAYLNQVQIYGQHAVLECRSRMLSTTAYVYCLEANKNPDRSPAVQAKKS
jgi:hypothetical protein